METLKESNYIKKIENNSNLKYLLILDNYAIVQDYLGFFIALLNKKFDILELYSIDKETVFKVIRWLL